MASKNSGIKISAVIPAYNAERFLPRCLKSVFAQTLKPYEVIVVDDGSTDNTAALAEQLGAKVIRRQNGGIADARNTGIQNASCEWIAMLDVDDLWAPEKLERQSACIQSDTVLLYTGIRIFDDSGVRSVHPAVDAISAKKMLRYCNSITPSSVMVRRDTFMQVGGFRKGINACEDWGLWFRMRPLGQFVAVPDALTDYYVHPHSLSSDPEKMLQGAEVIINMTLTDDLRGLNRWAWKRRIRAVQLHSAGLIARDNGLSSELRYLFRSLCEWPSPFWQPRRFATFLISARNQLRGRRGIL
jgi:glycosyltransferase involved in cell wall biosynthesis